MPKGIYKHKPHTAETKKKISIANKGRVISEDTKRKLSKALRGNKNCLYRFVSKEMREKISKGNMGNTKWLGKHHSELSRKRISEKLKGRLVSEETRIKLSESHKGQIPWNKGKKTGLSWNKGKKCPQLSKALKGKPSSMLGKHHSEETKKKIGNSLRGHLVSRELKERLSKISKNMSEETKKKMSEAKKGTRLSLNQREKISEALKGRMPKNIQRKGKFGNVERGYYNIGGKKIFFRSRWEANYALYLGFLIKQKQIKKWEYEKDVFIFEKIKFGTRSYRPDFKICNNDNTISYHEVKGYLTSQGKTKIKRFKKYYPEEFAKLEFIIPDKYSRSKANGEMIKFLVGDLGIDFEKIMSYKEVEKYSKLIPNWE